MLLYEDCQAGQTFATVHDVAHNSEGADPKLSPARLVTLEALRPAFDALTQSGGVTFLPWNTLVHEPGLLACHEPASTRRLWFQTSDEFLDRLRSQEFPQPLPGVHHPPQEPHRTRVG